MIQQLNCRTLKVIQKVYSDFMYLQDNFIKNKKLQGELRAVTAKGFNWFDSKDNPKNSIYSLIKKVWPKHNYEGFEYWVIDYPVGDSMDWHNDKDEYAYKNFNTIVTPDEGIVYYTHAEDLEGGVLEISNGPRKKIKIHPKTNRLVRFKTGMPHRVTKIKKGKRKAILVNAWTNKPQTFL